MRQNGTQLQKHPKIQFIFGYRLDPWDIFLFILPKYPKIHKLNTSDLGGNFQKNPKILRIQICKGKQGIRE